MLRIRLSRHGAKKDPHYRVVVAEKRSPRDGRFVEIVGHYHPTMNPTQLELKLDRINYWVGNGAQLTGTVKSLLKRAQSQPEEPSAEAAPQKAPAEKDGKPEPAQAEAKEAKPEEPEAEKAEAKNDDSVKAKTEEAASEEKADQQEPEVAAET